MVRRDLPARSKHPNDAAKLLARIDRLLLRNLFALGLCVSDLDEERNLQTCKVATLQRMEVVRCYIRWDIDWKYITGTIVWPDVKNTQAAENPTVHLLHAGPSTDFDPRCNQLALNSECTHDVVSVDILLFMDRHGAF